MLFLIWQERPFLSSPLSLASLSFLPLAMVYKALSLIHDGLGWPPFTISQQRSSPGTDPNQPKCRQLHSIGMIVALPKSPAKTTYWLIVSHNIRRIRTFISKATTYFLGHILRDQQTENKSSCGGDTKKRDVRTARTLDWRNLSQLDTRFISLDTFCIKTNKLHLLPEKFSQNT